MLVVDTISAKDDYVFGIVSSAYSCFVFILSSFVAVVLGFIVSQLSTPLGSLIAFLIISAGAALYFATLYKCIKELFEISATEAAISAACVALGLLLFFSLYPTSFLMSSTGTPNIRIYTTSQTQTTTTGLNPYASCEKLTDAYA
ncbi:MAG: hypothetical protein QW400_03725, partial [Candidatus Diapherotrites archaeon]